MKKQLHSMAASGCLLLLGGLTMAGADSDEMNSTPILKVNPHDPDAYHSIQAAMDEANPGDVVEVIGGIYNENIKITRGGLPGRPVTLRAAGNQLVVVNAGQLLETEWTSVEHLPEVFQGSVSSDWMGEENGFWEMPGRVRLANVHTPEQAGRRLGSWHYDETSESLYIRGSGVGPTDTLTFWRESEAPVIEVDASHVRIENLHLTLGSHGILFGRNTSHVEVIGCQLYANSGAGIHMSGDDHRLESNEVFNNNGYGIQMRYGISRARVLNNLCYLNGPNNGESTATSVTTDLGLFSQGGYNLMQGNVADGVHKYSFRNKYGANPTTIFRNNVVRGHLKAGPYGVYDNTFIVDGLGMRPGMYMNGGEPSPLRSWDRVDPEGLQREGNLIHPLVAGDDPRFADPAYRDFRLQSDSPNLGSGAYPGRAMLFYIDPETGNDEALGTAEQSAFQTITRALQVAPAGSTLYLMPGVYDEEIVMETGGLDSGEPFRLRAFGKQPGVVLAGPMTLNGAPDVELDGLEFAAAKIRAEESPRLTIRNSVFHGENPTVTVEQSPGLRVDRCTFGPQAGPVTLEKSPDAAVTQTIFLSDGPAYRLDPESKEGFFSEFNLFAQFKAELEDSTITWADWRESTNLDLASDESTVEVDETWVPVPQSPALEKGVDFAHVGARGATAATRLRIANLEAAGLAPTGATLLWDSPAQASLAEIRLETGDGQEVRTWQPEFLFQIMGEFFDMTDRMEAFFSSQRHAVVSDLEPDTEYRAVVTALDPAGDRGDSVTVEFRTPAALAESRTFYVGPEGDDAASGSGPDQAWASFAHATSRLSPGDELVLLPGTYREILRPRVSGTAEAPIVIRSKEPQQAVIDLGEQMPVAVEILNTNHVVIDGLFLTGGAFSRGHAYIITHAKGITVRNCEMDYPSRSDWEQLRLGHGGLIANRAPDLRVENNLFLCGVVAAALSHSPGAVVRGNTIIGEGNYGVVIVAGDSEEPYTIEDNIFYRTVMGYKTGPAIWVFDPMPTLVSDHNLFFIPEEHKGTIGKLPETDRLVPLEVWQSETGLDPNSVEAEALFVDPEGHNFRLREESPGATGARDGGPVGRRFP